jgi:preprotein translocase subunit SecE
MSTEANKIQAIAKMNESENRRYVVLFQLLLTVGIGYSLSRAIELIYRVGSLPVYRPFGVHEAWILGYAIAAGALVYTMRNVTAQDFANEVIVELRKVTWPTMKETRQATMVVIVVVAVIATILGAFDFMWAKLIQFLLTYGAT